MVSISFQIAAFVDSHNLRLTITFTGIVNKKFPNHRIQSPINHRRSIIKQITKTKTRSLRTIIPLRGSDRKIASIEINLIRKQNNRKVSYPI